ncbi:MAG: HAD family phosphatase [Dehalococcoidia bacterium]|nr:HAD family phosphatase [Dehalococcoidia bacterium]
MIAGGYRAVIFDMDGVLVDSEPAFFEALNDVLRPTGKRIEWERYKQLLGTSVSNTWRKVMDMLDIDGEPAEYAERYNEVLIEHLSRPRPLLPGAGPLLAELRDRGHPVGLATSSWQPWVEAVLGAARLPLDTFDAVVWRQMAGKSKPAPDLYLKAAELLGVAPARCIAIEDTPAGIASAKAAGMYAVQARASSTAFPPIEGADLVIESLEHFPLALLDSA